LEVVGSRELGFFPGTCRGGAFKGFQYNSEEGARAAKLTVKTDALSGAGAVVDEFRCYCNGGGVFVGAHAMRREGVEVLAEYAEEIAVDSGDARPAVVYCKVGEGAALLTGPHPE
jgi:biotin--protein ligase